MKITFTLKFIQFILLSFERSKERSKEKSPAGNKLPENSFVLTAKISTHHPSEKHRRVAQTGNFCFSSIL